MTRPSSHLTWVELACQDAAQTPYAAAWRKRRAIPLAAVAAVGTVAGARTCAEMHDE